MENEKQEPFDYEKVRGAKSWRVMSVTTAGQSKKPFVYLALKS